MIRDEIKLAGLDLIIKRKKVKNINLRFITAGELRVTAPIHTTESRIDQVLKKKLNWILKHHKLLTHQASLIEINPDIFVFMGKEYNIEYNFLLLDGVEIDHENRKLIAGFGIKINLYYDQIYQSMAKTYLKPRVFEIAREYGFSLNKVFIRGQKTVWGSCSSKGNISLNWKLMIAPDFVIEYLIFHELLHTRHPNHGEIYKKELRQIYPRTDEAELWLKQHSQLLKMY
ncbi:MAG: SprT family zinc-dependent metalloprotease [Candidatus Stygibacter australis]|nr:SprT family zinc-dependent metalloprotease [Candidatus Stygibacter australis]MDP8323394.1 SprT family zinc-dependent metalloprotease [Candidatus Stygibacter australis]